MIMNVLQKAVTTGFLVKKYDNLSLSKSFSESAISFGSHIPFLSSYLSFYILNSYHPDVDLISPRELHCVDKNMWQKICVILKPQFEHFVFSLKK